MNSQSISIAFVGLFHFVTGVPDWNTAPRVASPATQENMFEINGLPSRQGLAQDLRSKGARKGQA
jgi:hypothetical protein